MTKTLATLAVLLILTLSTSFAAAQEVAVPAANPLQVTSLRRSSPDWDVRTTIWLRADAMNVSDLKFEITSPPSKGTLICNKACADGQCQTREPSPVDPPVNTSRSCRCEYLPTPGESGADYFYYIAKAATGSGSATVRSQPAKVDIDIQTRGLRWELIPVGTTGLSSDTNAPHDIPSIFGKTAQDFLFVLNWVTDFPSQAIKADRSAVGVALTSNDLVSPVSRSVNVGLRTGLITTPMTVDAIDHGPAAGSGGSATPPASTAAVTASLRRAFTFGGEANLNAVWKFDGNGAFLELGAVGKGAYDVATETDDSEIQTDRLFELLRHERGTFRWEGGVRFALKRDDPREATTLLVNGNRVEHGRNAEDLLVIEALIARDNALADLPAGDGDSRNRWVLRLIAMPPIPGVSLPGNMRPTFGVETSRAIGGGEQIIRFIYGANVGFK